ncbi:MAG: hypothetical protein V7L23_32460 [Nostoc sp.]|uniref:hypothetical protein n=1 Tax=Nostoc sp. TaxID=1180 RepID=UPI002FF11CE5
MGIGDWALGIGHGHGHGWAWGKTSSVSGSGALKPFRVPTQHSALLKGMRND